MSHQSVQIDPLDSPHPVPWTWVMATLTAASTNPATGGAIDSPQLFYYRSQSLVSPDGQYAAYSRVQMQVTAQFFQTCVTSILFLENLKTGDLQAITPTSPLAKNPFASDSQGQLGTISIVIPVSWSESSDRLLAREFESLFCSDVASDYAVVVDCAQFKVSTVSPTHLQYTTAILLGWSQSEPAQVLFRAGSMGEENWGLWMVDVEGQTVLAEGDRAVIFGQTVSNVWMGPQIPTYS
jgi:hypothetical protein